MRFTLLILALVTVSACGRKDGPPDDSVCTLTPTLDDARPDILIIGDSISIGYRPKMQITLSTYDVSHNCGNARWSTIGARDIDGWLFQRPHWDAITFNHGLWDARYDVDTPGEVYKVNMTIIARKIKLATSKPLFVTTTEILPGTPKRKNHTVIGLNKIAVEVMIAEGIPVLDLYAVSQTIRPFHLNQHNVHYTSTGYEILAKSITDELFNLYGIQ